MVKRIPNVYDHCLIWLPKYELLGSGLQRKDKQRRDDDTEPVHMTLHKFWNTSSSGLSYEVAYTEARGRMKKGDRLWQIALGSGFKCNNVVWEVLGGSSPPMADCSELRLQMKHCCMGSSGRFSGSRNPLITMSGVIASMIIPAIHGIHLSRNISSVWNDCINGYPCNTWNLFEREYKQRFQIVSKPK